ncbi:MAG: DUF2249 domain-containing protein [Nitrospirae bacterium]|nr:DUF2249 domain-containing protein [Nitrospirota bacterium]
MIEKLKSLPKEKIVDLDVRPELDAGRDPFNLIIKTLGSMSDDQVLHLVIVFEPVPLYTVLQMKGYDHKTEQINGLWHIYFYKGETGAPAGKIAGNEESASEEQKTIEIDVRGLEPPEPMVKILELLPQVGKNSTLLVHHHREPVMLYDKLEHLGFQASSEKIQEGYYKVRITKKG